MPGPFLLRVRVGTYHEYILLEGAQLFLTVVERAAVVEDSIEQYAQREDVAARVT